MLFYYYYYYLRGHLFHALRLHPEARVTSQAIVGFCPVRSSRHLALSASPGDRRVSSSYPRADRASHTAEKLQGGFCHARAPARCSEAAARPGRRRARRRVAAGRFHSVSSGASAPPLLGFQAAAPGGAAATLSRGREGDGVPNTSAPALPRALSGAELPPQPAPPPASRPRPAAAAEPLLLGGVRGSRAAALGPTARGRRRLIPRTAWERRAGGRTGARERAAAPRAGAGRLRQGPASGGSHARAGDGAGPRPWAGPWPMEARGARSGCAADTGWAERIGGGGRGPASRPDSRVGVPGRRSVRCARTLPAAAPLPRPAAGPLGPGRCPEPRAPGSPGGQTRRTGPSGRESGAEIWGSRD